MDCKKCPYKRECHELPSNLSCDDVLAIMKDEPPKEEAFCEKYDLEADFADNRKINRLECIEDKPKEE